MRTILDWGMDERVGPEAKGERLAWEELPESVRQALEDHFGARVERAETQVGGFSPGAASRLALSDGQRIFVKAVGSHPNTRSPNIHRSEARIAAALPEATPSPRLLWTFDDGDWVALVFEDIEGHTPRLPWERSELERVLAAVTDLTTILTPAPIEVPAAAEQWRRAFTGWRRFAATSESGEIEALDSWSRHHVDHLAALESDWQDAAAGNTLLHNDVRADNLLITPAKVYFVDWPWASIGAEWFDLVLMLPSVAMQGGPDPDAIVRTHPLTKRVDDDALNSVLAAAAGFFMWFSAQPPDPGLPTLREFQRAQGVRALAWLRRRTGWA